MNKLFFGIFILFSFWGCKQSPIEFPSDSVPKIVLYGFISPQGAKLNISQSTPFGQELFVDDVYLNDAIPVIQKADGEVLDTLVRIDGLGNYKFSKHVNIEANKSYLVKVFCEGFEPATTTIEIPKSMPSAISSTVVDRSSYSWSVSLDFDYFSDTYYLFQVDGFDVAGVKRPVRWQDNTDYEQSSCPYNWVDPLFFAHSSCLHNPNPTISTMIYKETTNWDTGERIALKKVKYRISVIDEKYKNIFEEIDGLLLGYVEPILTEGFVQGGYGFIVPFNSNTVDVYF